MFLGHATTAGRPVRNTALPLGIRAGEESVGIWRRPLASVCRPLGGRGERGGRIDRFAGWWHVLSIWLLRSFQSLTTPA